MAARKKYPDGMGRRRQIRWPDAMDDLLNSIAREYGCSVSDLVRDAVTKVYILPRLGTNHGP